MRKTVIIIAALLLAAVTAKAQTNPHEINFYIGGYNSQFLEYNTDQNTAMDLYSLYEPMYNVTTGPVLTVDYNYSVLKWLSVGAQLHYSQITVNSYTRIEGSSNTAKRNIFCFLPEAKLRIPSPAHFRMYGRLAAGISYTPSLGVRFAYDIVPFGIEWGGQRVYGTAEVVYGNVIKGGRIGMGFRF